jgi:hypothetical protein
LAAKKAHYFPANDLTSLCGRWIYSDKRDPQDFISDDDCVACRRLVDKAKKKQATTPLTAPT